MGLPFGLLLALYFVCELCFAAAAKSLAEPLRVLPTSVGTAAACWWCYLLVSGEVRRLRADRDVVVGALGSAAILLAATVAYSLRGVSIMLPLFLMKAGGLVVAPAVDAAQGVAPSRRALGVLGLVAAGVVAVMWTRIGADGTAAALACAAVYLGGYALKLGPVGRRRGDWAFFVSVTTATLALALPASIVILRAASPSTVALPLPSLSPLAFLSGAASQGCGVFGGLLLLRGASARDRARGLASHAALFPLHRSVGVLAGMAATAVLAVSAIGPAAAWHRGIFAPGEPIGAACLLAALWVGTR